MKKVFLLVLLFVFAFTLSGCKDDSVELNHYTIGVAHYNDNGPAVDAIKAYLEGLGAELNFDIEFVKLDQRDEATNLTKIQELIAAGADGILISMDLGMPAIIEECEAAGVYVAGFLSDYNTSYTNTFDDVFGSDYFLGTVADGYAADQVTRGQSFFDSLIEYNESHPGEELTHVSMVTFPIWAFPSHHVAAAQFVAAVDEYNLTATTPITVDALDSEVDIISFQPISSTYFTKHPDIDAIMSFASGAGFVYPPMVTAGYDTTLKLFTAGWETGIDTNFGSNGTETYVHTEVAATESLVYPLVLLLNALYGVEFSDQVDAERVNVAPIVINSPEDLTVFETNIYYTGLYEDAMFDADDVLNLTAFGNEDATYADLLAVLESMQIDDIE